MLYVVFLYFHRFYSSQNDWCSRYREINIPKSVIISIWPKKNVIIKTKSYKGSEPTIRRTICERSGLAMVIAAPVGAATVSSAIPGKTPDVVVVVATDGPAWEPKSCHPRAWERRCISAWVIHSHQKKWLRRIFSVDLITFNSVVDTGNRSKYRYRSTNKVVSENSVLNSRALARRFSILTKEVRSPTADSKLKKRVQISIDFSGGMLERKNGNLQNQHSRLSNIQKQKKSKFNYLEYLIATPSRT